VYYRCFPNTRLPQDKDGLPAIQKIERPPGLSVTMKDVACFAGVAFGNKIPRLLLERV
jgi:hypothetical protein